MAAEVRGTSPQYDARRKRLDKRSRLCEPVQEAQLTNYATGSTGAPDALPRTTTGRYGLDGPMRRKVDTIELQDTIGSAHPNIAVWRPQDCLRRALKAPSCIRHVVWSYCVLCFPGSNARADAANHTTTNTVKNRRNLMVSMTITRSPADHAGRRWRRRIGRMQLMACARASVSHSVPIDLFRVQLLPPGTKLGARSHRSNFRSG